VSEPQASEPIGEPRASEPIGEPRASEPIGTACLGPQGRPRRLRAAATTAGVVAAVASAVFVARRLADGWAQAGPALRSARPVWLVAALVCAAGAMVVVARAWVAVIRALGGTIEHRRGAACYFAGEIGKYLPGAVWPIVGRGELARRAGVRRGVAYASVVVSLGLWYLGASLVAVVLAPWVAGDGPWPRFGGVAVALVAVGGAASALHPSVGARLLARVERMLRGRALGITVPSWRQSIALAAGYLPAWAGISAATWCMTVALGAGSEVDAGRVVFAATLSWLVGFLALPVPGGVGVREAVFVTACGLPGGLGAAVAVSARLIFVAVDAGGALVAGASVTRARARRRPVGEAATPR